MDSANVFLHGSDKQDCKSKAASTAMAGTERGDRVAEMGVFHHMKYLL